VEAARVLAQRILRDTPALNDRTHIDMAFERTLGRVGTPEEHRGLLSLLGSFRQQFTKDPDAAARLLKIGISPKENTIPEPELAAWTSLCRVLLNLHETITRY
jgi:hypothetical protein